MTTHSGRIEAVTRGWLVAISSGTSSGFFPATLVRNCKPGELRPGAEVEYDRDPGGTIIGARLLRYPAGTVLAVPDVLADASVLGITASPEG